MPEPLTLTATIGTLIASIPSIIGNNHRLSGLAIIALAVGNYGILETTTFDLMGLILSLPFTLIMTLMQIQPYYLTFPIINGFPISTGLFIVYGIFLLFKSD